MSLLPESTALGEYSSDVEIKQFEESNVWLDIKEVFTKRLFEIQQELEQATDGPQIYRLQGEIKSIRAFIDIPSILRFKEAQDGY